MRTNRLVSFLLICCLILSVFPQLAVSAAEESTAQMEYEFLKKLEVISGQFSLESEVGRDEFAGLIAKMLYPGLDLSLAGDINAPQPFRDVEPSNRSYHAIRLLKELGVLSGDTGSEFRPDEKITYNEAAAMLIKALGYAVYAQEKGGYPSGYLMIANDAGITKGVSYSVGGITGNTAVKLLYNALFADMVSVVSYENGKPTSQIIRDKNLLSERLNIFEYDAVVVDDGFSTLDGSVSVGEEKAVVREVKTDAKLLVEDPEYLLSDFLGCHIKLFLQRDKQTDQMRIVYCAPHRKGEITRIPADQIISVSDEVVEYETEKDAEHYRKIRLTSGRPYALFNGVKKASYDAGELKPENGFLTLIDNDGDGNADVVRVTSFSYHIIVDKIDMARQILFCKQNPRNNFDFSDDSQLHYRAWKENKPISLDTIQESDVISVAKSEKNAEGKTLYTLMVSSQSVTDSVASIQQSENAVELKESGICEISPFYLSVRPKLLEQIGFDGDMTFRLDCLGKIAHIDKLSVQNKNFVYLIDMKQETGLESGIILKFYDSAEGMVRTLPISSKVKIDGKKPADSESFTEIQKMLCTRPDGTVTVPKKEETDRQNKAFTSLIPRPAILKLDAQEQITEIDTDAVTHDESSLEAEDSNALKAGIRNAKDQPFQTKSGTFDGGYYVNGETVILKVPDVDRYGLDVCVQRYVPTWRYSEIQTSQFEMDLREDANFKTMFLSELDENMNYDAQAYNVDPKTGVAELLVIRGRYEYFYHKNNFQAPFCVYLKMAEYVDVNTKKIMKKIYYYDGGEEKSAIVDEETLHPWYRNIIFGGQVPAGITYTGKEEQPETAKYIEVEKLQQGDIIYLETSGGLLSHIQREINLSLINQKSAGSLRPSARRYPYSNGAYSVSTVDIPFDQRIYSSYSFSETYNLNLGVAMDMIGSTLLFRQPAKSGSNIGCFADYIGNESELPVWDKYINLNDVKITVVEEAEDEDCDVEHDSCKVKIRAGTLADIRTASSFAGDAAKDGFYKASRIYGFSRYGVFSEIVIFNLSEHHNRTK